jgi:hypothetical protein
MVDDLSVVLNDFRFHLSQITPKCRCSRINLGNRFNSSTRLAAICLSLQCFQNCGMALLSHGNVLHELQYVTSGGI